MHLNKAKYQNFLDFIFLILDLFIFLRLALLFLSATFFFIWSCRREKIKFESSRVLKEPSSSIRARHRHVWFHVAEYGYKRWISSEEHFGVHRGTLQSASTAPGGDGDDGLDAQHDVDTRRHRRIGLFPRSQLSGQQPGQ